MLSKFCFRTPAHLAEFRDWGGGKALPEKAKLCAYATRIPTPSSDLDKQKQIWSDQGVCQSG